MGGSLGESQPQNVAHGVAAGGTVRQTLRRLKRTTGVAIAAMSPMRQLQRFAEGAEEDRVFANIVADADGVNADLVWRTFANQSLAAVAEIRLTHRLLYKSSDVQGG